MKILRTHCVTTLDDPNGAPTERRELVLRCGEERVQRVLSDIRSRAADGERSPVLARHMQALGLDDMLLGLARGQ